MKPHATHAYLFIAVGLAQKVKFTSCCIAIAIIIRSLVTHNGADAGYFSTGVLTTANKF